MTVASITLLQTNPKTKSSSDAEPSNPASRALVCRHDGAPCEVVDRFDAELTEEDRARLHKLVERYLPCCSCRGVDATVTKLRGVRLGRTERLVLLRAAPTTEPKGAIVATADGTRAARESALRAARKLFDLFLLQISHEDVRVSAGGRTRNARFRVAWRTPLAEEIVKRFRRELESGARIRWDRRLDAGAEAARRDIVFLLRALIEPLEGVQRRGEQLLGLLMAIGNGPDARIHGQRAVDAHTLLVAVRRALDAAGALRRPRRDTARIAHQIRCNLRSAREGA